MIQEVTMYTVVCDNCGEDAFTDSDFSCWCDQQVAEEFAKDDWGYIEHEGKHYCPKCYEYDDDDNLIIKQKEG